MKKFLLGSAALIALASQASAADLAARPYTKAPPMVAAIYDWTGFYIGVNGGYGSERSRWSSIAGVNFGSHDADGGTAGGQIGYRWQTGAWVWGLEAQGNWADFRGSHTDLVTGFNDRSRTRAFGLFTGQVGYAWNNALLYAKGGAAVTDTRYDFRVVPGAPVFASTRDNANWGATVGGGLEFGFAPNWSAGVEYNHIFQGRRNLDVVTTPGGALVGQSRFGSDIDMVTARINYRWGGPIVARY